MLSGAMWFDNFAEPYTEEGISSETTRRYLLSLGITQVSLARKRKIEFVFCLCQNQSRARQRSPIILLAGLSSERKSFLII